MSRSIRFIHSFGIEFIVLKTELLENRLIVWDLDDSKKLFGQGYYGKPIGIPKPKLDEINVPLILDLIEGYYLLEMKKITITKLKQKIKTNEMIEICKKEVHDFEKKYIVYKNFRDKGYIINPGIKFGCDFAVYEKGPGIDHAPFLIQVYNRNEPITSTGIVLAGRLATTVRKQFILAIPKGKDKVDFLALDWWKA